MIWDCEDVLVEAWGLHGREGEIEVDETPIINDEIRARADLIASRFLVVVSSASFDVKQHVNTCA